MKDAVCLAIEALSWMELEGLSERAAFARALRQLNVTQTDALKTAQFLVLETARRRNFVDFLVKKALNGRPELDALPHGVSSFLRMFCYWTKFRESRHDDAVPIAKAARSVLGGKTMRPIEPALGRILALKPDEELVGLKSDQALALRLFHPIWYSSACTLLLGRSAALRLVSRNMGRAPTYVRVNTLRANEESCLGELKRAGIVVEATDALPSTYKVVSSRRPLARTEPFKKGRIAVQDKASILTGLVANPRPGDSVVDVCAAPGLKTTHLAQLMNNKGTICSIDKSTTRMSQWVREVSRLGVAIADPVVADASRQLPITLEADVVVLDPPCTNTGTFWRSPATKWTVRPESFHQLPAEQFALLQNAARCVRKGGTLVYSTCSIFPEENERVVERFLRVNPEFEAVEASPRIGLEGVHGVSAAQRLYPHIHECNGHFILKMKYTG